MVKLESYRERIVNYICGGYNLESLHAIFIRDMTEDRVRSMTPALTYDRCAKKGPYLFTIDDYYSVISKHLPCIREGTDKLKVKMRWDPEYFILRFSEDTLWLSFYQDNGYSFELMLTCNIDPNEMLYTICDIEYTSNSWEQQWEQLFEECKRDCRYLEELRQRMLKTLEKEMRGTFIDYTVEVGPKTSKVEVETHKGQCLVLEVSNYDFERTLRNVGFLVVHTLLGLDAMDVEPQMTIENKIMSGVSIESLPAKPLEQSPYVDVTRYITELTDAVLHHHEDDQRRLLPLANKVLGQSQLAMFAMTLRGQDSAVLCDETLCDGVSVFFPMRLIQGDAPDSRELSYYSLGCFFFQCFFVIDIEVPEDVVCYEWFNSDELTICFVVYEDEKTLVLVEFSSSAITDSIPVNYQGASIEHAIMMEKDHTVLCDVMDDGVFRLFALPMEELAETEE